MRRILAGQRVWKRIQFPNRPFCSAARNSKPTTNNGSSSSSSPPSLSNYDEQYKALNNLNFWTAAEIVFNKTPKKKKFGLDFHLVQLFFVCLPSLAVYLVAQYARSEMKKMDAELERKKQTEFEAQAKQMELNAAEEKAKVASNPALMEVKDRLDKLEQIIKEIVVEPKKQLNDATKEGREDSNEQKKAAEA
ncbi:hypothetical protein ACS0TY_021243 [Phlomoides rotata]